MGTSKLNKQSRWISNLFTESLCLRFFRCGGLNLSLCRFWAAFHFSLSSWLSLLAFGCTPRSLPRLRYIRPRDEAIVASRCTDPHWSCQSVVHHSPVVDVGHAVTTSQAIVVRGRAAFFVVHPCRGEYAGTVLNICEHDDITAFWKPARLVKMKS